MALVTTLGTPDVISIQVAVALADSLSNPTVNLQGACVLCWNGSTWDRVSGDTTGLYVHGPAAENAAVGGNPLLAGGRYDATPRTLDDGDVGAVALDADAAVHVSDGGNSLTVDGTVTANLSATDNAVLDAIQAAVEGTLTVGSHAVQEDGAALTALQLIDDAVYTDGTGTPSKGLAVMGTDGTNPQLVSVTTGGHVHIHDGGNAITVDGTVAVSGTVTVGSHAVTNAGTFAVQEDGAALTALQLIDDAVYTDGTGTPSKGILIMGSDGTNPQSILTNTQGCIRVINASGGALLVGTHTDDTAFSGSTNIVAVGGVYNAILDPVDDGDGGACHITEYRGLHVNLRQADGTEITSGGGVEAEALRVTIASDSTGVLSVDDNGGALTVDGTVNLAPTTSGGLTPFYSVDLDESEEQIKATAGQVYGWQITNVATTPRYVKFYNATAATVVVGTTAPAFTLEIPSQGDANAAGVVMPIAAMGIEFTTAITVAATTGAADNDTGAPGAGEVKIAVFYK